MRTYAYEENQPPPVDEADELTWLLYRQHRVIARRQALRFISDKAIRARLRSRRWQAAAHGVYLTHNGPLTREQHRWIAVLAAAADRAAVLAGISALEAHGLRGHGSDTIHVLIPAHCQERHPPTGVIAHRTSRLPASDIHAIGQPPRTVMARSLVDAAQWAGSDDRARVVIAAAFQQGLAHLDQLVEVLDRMPRARRRVLIREIAADAAGGAQSLPEAEFLRLCRRGGLPQPTRQVKRRDARGRFRYLDVYFKEWQIHVEIDGGQHMEVGEWWTDMWRQNELWIPGDRVLRFPSWAIRHRQRDVTGQLRAALVAAGWRPPSRDLGR